MTGRLFGEFRSWTTDRKLSVLFVLIALIAAGVNAVLDSEWNRFRVAKKLDSVHGWTSFMETASDPEYISIAEERLAASIESDLWMRASRYDLPDLLQSYVQQYPSGRHNSEAKLRLNELGRNAWAKLSVESTREEVLLIQSSFGQTAWADSARELYSVLAERALLNLPDNVTEVELSQFIDSWPYSKAMEVAVERREELWDSIEWVRSTDTKRAYKRFIARNPNSIHVSHCRRRLIDIEVDEALANRSELGGLPAMNRISAASGTRSKVAITNDTGHVLDVLYSGPTSERVTIGIGGTTRAVLDNGRYRILASVRTGNVSRYFGEESLIGGEYNVTYYISLH